MLLLFFPTLSYVFSSEKCPSPAPHPNPSTSTFLPILMSVGWWAFVFIFPSFFWVTYTTLLISFFFFSSILVSDLSLSLHPFIQNLSSD